MNFTYRLGPGFSDSEENEQAKAKKAEVPTALRVEVHSEFETR